MNDKNIITQKERNYIETLYLYCNLEDFTKHEEHHPTFAYYNMHTYFKDVMLKDAEILGVADGRQWYQFPNYRIGIMDYDKGKISNQHNCLIQYEQHHMWTLDKNLSNLDLPFGSERHLYQIKRIDITKIAKLSEDYTTNYGYISPYRGMRNEYGTIYLGHRKNGNVFRIYNKTKELHDKEDYNKIEILTEYFGDVEDLYTFELELHRKILKGSLGIETLEDLDKVYTANQNITSQIKFYKDNDRNKRLIKNNNRDRLFCRVLTDFIEYDRVTKKGYKPSFSYAVDKMVKTADKYLYKLDIEPTNEEYIKFANAFLARRVSIKNKEIEINFKDTVASEDYDKMIAKFEDMRDGQSNELEIEARNTFTYKPNEATLLGEVSKGTV